MSHTWLVISPRFMSWMGPYGTGVGDGASVGMGVGGTSVGTGVGGTSVGIAVGGRVDVLCGSEVEVGGSCVG